MQICDEKLTEDIPELVRAVLEKGDLRLEAKWLKNKLESENSPVVFSHNDMQEGNILISRNADVETNSESHIVIIGKIFSKCNHKMKVPKSYVSIKAFK